MIREVWGEAMANGGWPAVLRDLVGLLVIFAAILSILFVGSGSIS